MEISPPEGQTLRALPSWRNKAMPIIPHYSHVE
jgi:hypothetical protein